jgi:N-formylglutamate deformylase
MRPNVVVHIPHASVLVPSAEATAFLLRPAELARELLSMTDRWTDDLFPVTGAEAGRIVFGASRLVCDVERFPDDRDEPMAARGMGMIYTRTSTGAPLRALPPADERRRVHETWYAPHHARLAAAVHETVAAAGHCLIIDAHSFARHPLPHEPDQAPDRPAICIGTDPFHTPPALRDAAVAAAAECGWSVAVDRPFAGALVPAAVYRTDSNVLSLMIEVRRDLYMDEGTGEKTDAFAGVSSGLAVIIKAAAETAARHVLVGAYRATRYVAGEGEAAIVLRVGERSEPLFRLMSEEGVRSAAFITAWNPLSDARPLADNEDAQRALAADVRAAGWHTIAGHGQGDDGTWPPEPSLLVLGIDEAAARALMVRYRQNAIVWCGEDGVPQLLVNDAFGRSAD